MDEFGTISETKRRERERESFVSVSWRPLTIFSLLVALSLYLQIHALYLGDKFYLRLIFQPGENDVTNVFSFVVPADGVEGGNTRYSNE